MRKVNPRHDYPELAATDIFRFVNVRSSQKHAPEALGRRFVYFELTDSKSTHSQTPLRVSYSHNRRSGSPKIVSASISSVSDFDRAVEFYRRAQERVPQPDRKFSD